MTRETAQRAQADLIVAGAGADSHPRAVVAGPLGRQILQGAPCSVALAPAGFAQSRNALAPVGAGFDGSWESRLALATAAGLADALAGELRVLSVLKRPAAARPMFTFTSYHRHLAQLAQLATDCRSRMVEAFDRVTVHPEIEPVIVDGEPAEVLAHHSREPGLLVMGSRGYGPLRSAQGACRTRCSSARPVVMLGPRGATPGFGSPILRDWAAHPSYPAA